MSAEKKGVNNPGCEKTDGVWRLIQIVGLVIVLLIFGPGIFRGCKTNYVFIDYANPPAPNNAVTHTRLAVKGVWTEPVTAKWGQQLHVSIPNQIEANDVWLLERLNGTRVIERPPGSIATGEGLPDDVKNMSVSSVEFMIDPNRTHVTPRETARVQVTLDRP